MELSDRLSMKDKRCGGRGPGIRELFNQIRLFEASCATPLVDCSLEDTDSESEGVVE